MRAAVASIALLLLSIFAFAQDTTDNKTYRIRVDDVLSIAVYGESQATATVPVGQDGMISAPFVGLVQAEGKTTAELEATLVDLYRAKLRLRDPKVNVSIQQFAPYRAFVGGAFQRPGQYTFRPGDTILTLVNQAGDAVESAANLHRARLTRKGSSESIPIDLYAMLYRGELSQNYVLEDGDRLELPIDQRRLINVLGFIPKPGPYPYREPTRLADIIAQAGGEIAGKSMLSQIRIYRELPGSPGSVMVIRPNFVQYQVKGDLSQNVELQPGDFVYVPATKWGIADVGAAASVLNSVLFLDSFLRNGIFGLRIFR